MFKPFVLFVAGCCLLVMACESNHNQFGSTGSSSSSGGGYEHNCPEYLIVWRKSIIKEVKLDDGVTSVDYMGIQEEYEPANSKVAVEHLVNRGRDDGFNLVAVCKVSNKKLGEYKDVPVTEYKWQFDSIGE